MARTILKNKKINNLIRQTIIETTQEVLRDPDYGLEIKEWVKKRLGKQRKTLIPFDEIKKKYG